MPAIVVMGVSGCGKTTLAAGLAAALGWTLLEGDSFHPPANIAKMRAAIPLDDADRAPWLAAIAAAMDARLGAGAVVACSALKRAYRAVLIGSRPGVALIFLKGSRATIAARLAARRGHYMPPALLDSQLAALEEPGADEHPITLAVDPAPAAILAAALAALAERGIA
ncbi:MAG: gluconokinase [Acetobacteraceae bacterium]